jgi:DNA helicase HerA-like ATPase
VLEEAQRVLSKASDADVNVFPRVAREGRKFKVGLVAVTQQPKLVDPELLSQFNTFFILGLADERDRNILKGSAKQDLSSLNTEIQTLMPGECLLAGVDTPFAVPATIHLWRDALRAAVPPPEPRPVAAANVAAMLD